MLTVKTYINIIHHHRIHIKHIKKKHSSRLENQAGTQLLYNNKKNKIK